MNKRIKIIEDLNYIAEEKSNNPSIDLSKKLDEIKKLDDTDNFSKIINITEKYLKGETSKEVFEKEFKEEEEENISSSMEKIEDKSITENLNKAVIKEITEEYKAKLGENLSEEERKAKIEEIINSNDKITDPDKFKLDRAEIEKIKKIYTYKVEGKITSGIKELDSFLEIVQPVINLAIIQPWKVIYGIGDGLTAAKETFTNWQEKRKSLKEMWNTLKAMGVDLKEDELPLKLMNNEKMEDLVAGYFNSYMTNKLNNDMYEYTISKKQQELKKLELSEKDIKTELENYKNSDYIKTEKYKRTKLFDTTQDAIPVRKILDKELQNLIGNKCRDPQTGKISEDGENFMKGYAKLIDLFNKKDKDIIPKYYACDIKYIMEEANGRLFTQIPIEKEDTDTIIKTQDGEIEKMDQQNIFQNVLSKLQPNSH